MAATANGRQRSLAASEHRKPDLIPLLRSWGGATIAYRRKLVDSPSYTLNHEEVEKALEEGIVFAENLDPQSTEVDERGAQGRLVRRWIPVIPLGRAGLTQHPTGPAFGEAQRRTDMVHGLASARWA